MIEGSSIPIEPAVSGPCCGHVMHFKARQGRSLLNFQRPCSIIRTSDGEDNPYSSRHNNMYVPIFTFQGEANEWKELRWSSDAEDLLSRVPSKGKRQVVRDVENTVKDTRGSEVGTYITPQHFRW